MLHKSDEYLDIIKERGFGTNTLNERDDLIGLFELGNEEYLKPFNEGKLAILGDEFLTSLMPIPNCKANSNTFRYYTSKERFLSRNLAFGYSKCADPRVRKILDHR